MDVTAGLGLRLVPDHSDVLHNRFNEIARGLCSAGNDTISFIYPIVE